MSDEKIYQCEAKVKILSEAKGEYKLEWRSKPILDVLGKAVEEIRCKECHGAVRLHGRNVAHGPAPHAEHRHRRDSENCRAGHYFRQAGKTDDEHRESSNPVL
jgi:hypothetical protein